MVFDLWFFKNDDRDMDYWTSYLIYFKFFLEDGHC